MIRLNQRVWILALCVLTATLVISTSAQTYKELMSFNGNNAAGPETALVQGIDGNLYGTTFYGGTGTCFDGSGIGCGVVFEITRSGEFRIVYNFQENGPTHPAGDLQLADDGNFYGTMSGGGIIFKITPEGTYTTVHTFTGGLDGGGLGGGLLQGPDGNFYGTSPGGGAPSNFCPAGCGMVFKMTPAGTVTPVYSFCPQNYCPDGRAPEGTLAEGTDGKFYGTAEGGGLYKEGTIFRVSPDGDFTLLYTFPQELFPHPAGLTLATDGNFYGISGAMMYRVTPSGAFTLLQGIPANDLNFPAQASDGNFYGTSMNGGAPALGNIFEVPLDGTPSSLYSFSGYPDDGSYPLSNLVQATDGKFYGTTYIGGSIPCNYGNLPGCGTIFSLDMGLDPFVTFVRGARKIGQIFGILGQGFTGTTSVSLNGTSATFTVKSDTLIVATVPAGATTGYAMVTTPSGTLKSNVPFYVIP